MAQRLERQTELQRFCAIDETGSGSF
jgi:hypothetical protein